MAVRSKPTKGTPVSWDIEQAPLERENLNIIAPLIRILGGIFFLAWSWVSTVLIIGSLLEPVITGGFWGMGYSYLVAFVFAVFVTIAQWVTQGRFPFVHWGIILTLDAPLTMWQTKEWLYAIVKAKTEALPLWGDITIWILAIVGGIIAAKFGEALLLSKRKKSKNGDEPSS